MKKLLLLAALFLSATGGWAQREVGSLTVVPKVGLNVAKITSDKDADSRIGLALGAELEYQLTDIVSLSAGAIYSVQGARESVMNSDFGSTADATLKLNYINVPLLANVYVSRNLAVRVGIQPAINLTHKMKCDVGDVSAEVNVAGVKSIDFAIPVGLSYEYNNLVFDARYNIGVRKISGILDDSRNGVFQLTVGYRFDI